LRLTALILLAAVLLVAGLWPQIDLALAGFFYKPDSGFFLAEQPVFLFLHDVANIGARVLGIVLLIITAVAYFRHKAILQIESKGWLFLFLGLLLAPGLVANVILKDNWGRARPRQVEEFGGSMMMTPALLPQQALEKNGSFVAGDPSFGFYLTAFAYPVLMRSNKKQAKKLSRGLFWGGMGAGALLGIARVAMGAHFFSDVVFAAFFMLATLALLHAGMFGKKATAEAWNIWLCREK
jgi:lipid A 4'-phosphatase